MKTSTFIFIGIVAVAMAYVLGRHYERLALVQSEVTDIKTRLHSLEICKVRRDSRWEIVHRV